MPPSRCGSTRAWVSMRCLQRRPDPIMASVADVLNLQEVLGTRGLFLVDHSGLEVDVHSVGGARCRSRRSGMNASGGRFECPRRSPATVNGSGPLKSSSTVAEAGPCRTPPGWRTNEPAIKKTLPSQGFSLTIGTESEFIVDLPYMPLALAIKVTRAYRGASTAARALVDLHVEALANPGSNVGLFLLANALQLARHMLPGKTDSQRQPTQGQAQGRARPGVEAVNS